MTEVLRPDLFRLDAGSSFSPGFRVLRKNHNSRKRSFLSELHLLRNSAELSTLDNSLSQGEVAISESLVDSVEDGDIGVVSEKGTLRVILSRTANQNTVLVTERCNNRCTFCSQPPKESDDSWLLIQGAMAIADFGVADTVGITGGEPLIYGEAFLHFLEFVFQNSPQTDLHILSNGRAFSDLAFARKVAKLNTSRMTFGIPLYGAIPEIHDELVGSRGAFDETVTGLINAGNLGIPIELRFIPTRKNLNEMVPVTELAARCFSNISQISIMNLEPAGWAKKNWTDLYTDPSLYLDILRKAVTFASGTDAKIFLFNYPLCHLSDDLRPYAVQSISDWKNYYPEECNGCKLRDNCTGFFSSSQGKFHQSPRRII